MLKNHMQEKEVRENLISKENSGIRADYKPKDFVAKKVGDFWEVSFLYLNNYRCELHIKRNGIKQFKSLNAVGSSMRKMGVNEFRVIL